MEELVQNYMKFTTLDVKRLTDLKDNLRKGYKLFMNILTKCFGLDYFLRSFIQDYFLVIF